MSLLDARPAGPGDFLSAAARLRDPAATLTLFGAAVAAVGAFAAPARTFAALLVVALFLLGLGLAGLCSAAIHFTTGAGWDVVVRRSAERLAALVPAGSALAVLAVAAGGRWLYPSFGARGGLGHAGPFKELWLEPSFFLARAALYALVWSVFAWVLRDLSRRQDAGDPDGRLRRRATVWSAAFLPMFAVTLSAASFDWLMALEPHWYSTIFGVYQFAGLFAAGLAALILLVVRLRRTGPLAGVVTGEHLHDLGKLLFAMSTFWAYIWFSQAMLIWYGNLAEEVTYYVPRTAGAWAPIFWVVPVLSWGVPFLVLLPARAKRNEKVLCQMAGLILVGRLLDLVLAVQPSLFPNAPRFGGWEAGILLGGAGLTFLLLRRAPGDPPAVPVGDPYLVESLHHHE